jgi:hypothetical protein
MIAGVWWSISINAYIIDAIIAFSVVYKALDNLGAFRLWFGVQPNTKAATLIFGLLHGFGLATKIQDYDISPDGLLGNLIAFNVGVELGPADGAGADPAGDDPVAGAACLRAAGLCRECPDDGGWLCPDGPADHRLFRRLKGGLTHDQPF